MVQQSLFRIGQQVVTPVKRCTQRLVAWKCCAMSARQQFEAIIQAQRDFQDPERRGTRRGKFYCERDACLDDDRLP